MSDEELTKVGEATTEKVCTECHPFDDIIVARRTPREWRETVTQMASRGAVATPAQLNTIRQYLMRFYGVVAVNTASAADLASVLGLSAKEAETIVEHRKSNGKIGDLETLLKVPGLDKAKIEADPDALKFD